MNHPLGGKTSMAVGVMLGILAVPYFTPRLAQLRVAHAPWDKTPISADPSAVAQAPVVAPVLTQGETKLEASENQASITNALPAGPTEPASPAKAKEDTPAEKAATPSAAPAKPTIAIEDPSGKALDAFYTQLSKTKRKEANAVTRVMHYGDSMVVSDYVSGTMRRRMQTEFGDAGHGFILTANPWEYYFHNDLVHGASEGWSSSRVVGPLNRDAMYGLGGATFTGAPGATAWFGTSDRTSYGRKVGRFDVYYLETDTGGDVDAKADGKTERFSTKGAAGVKKSAVKSIPVTDGEQKLTLRVISGSPRIFGVALERDTAGVVYDALGLSGARAQLWNGIDQPHFTEQLALRKPNLVILHFGTNESETGIGTAEAYEKEVRTLVDKVKSAAPNVSILIVGPLDRAEKDDKGNMRTKPIIKKIVASQKNVAVAAGVAFYNTFDAMGGDGTMATWVRKGLAGSDLTHPSWQGAEIIGDLLFKALMADYATWQTKHP